jgi:hypothetical protein
MKKMIIVAFAIAALAACGGKKKPDTMNTGSGDMGSAAGSGDMGSGDMGSGDMGSGDAGSAAPEGGGSGM